MIRCCHKHLLSALIALVATAAFDCPHVEWVVSWISSARPCAPSAVPCTPPNPACLPPACADQVNANDTVCTVPRLMGYSHVGHAIQLRGDGGVDVQLHTTERLGEGIGLPDVAPAVGALVSASLAAKVGPNGQAAPTHG